MEQYTFGANILENLTTGMYQDSKVIFREYIQNACDQIDQAERIGLFRPRDPEGRYPDLGEGTVDIWLDADKRHIVVEDNATGIKAEDFKRILTKIADSDKELGKDKGFRGIGRLCGLAYCRRLIFSTRWAGEPVVSFVTCDALKMREMVQQSNTKVSKYSAIDVLNAVMDFDNRPAELSDPEHFFRVELIDINEENEELFGGRAEHNIEMLADYLSFVAPVPYQGDFYYRTEIYAHAKAMRYHIDEYMIRVNGEQIFKKYKTQLKTGNGPDEVFGVEFHDFYADSGDLLGWMWFGKTSFKAAIKEEERSRGLRLRKENIQIGEEQVLRGRFTRESSKRGNHYFIGEVFAVSPELIPNSQRSYFNENPVRIEFEHKLSDYFNHTLYNIYYEGSDINSSIKKISAYREKASEFELKKTQGRFLTPKDLQMEQEELKERERAAERAAKNLEKKRAGGRSILTREIIKRREAEFSSEVSGEVIKRVSAPESACCEPAGGYRIDSMLPRGSKKEKKLLEKILNVIRRSADQATADTIIRKIEEELR